MDNIPVDKIFYISVTMADDHIYGESKESSTRLDDIKYYTSMLLGTLCIVCVFGFLFLVPFVLDPAISTIMHEFIEKPVHCKVGLYYIHSFNVTIAYSLGLYT